jgi:hypothetical protein
MKILFQGGWQAGRDAPDIKEVITVYCTKLASYVVKNKHKILLTSSSFEFDQIIATEIVRLCKEAAINTKEHLLYVLPQREAIVPTEGSVVRLRAGPAEG